jgi:hypothetical protein
LKSIKCDKPSIKIGSIQKTTRGVVKKTTKVKKAYIIYNMINILISLFLLFKSKSESISTTTTLLANSNGKDITLNIFHGLGKILHRKNITDNFETNYLAPNLIKMGKQRPQLSVCPEEVYSKIPLTTDSIILYLFQNFIELFAIKSQNSNVDVNDLFQNMSSIYENFIISDFIKNNNDNYDCKLTNEMSAIISMRSILFNFYLPSSDKENKNGDKRISSWMPLRKPFNHNMLEIIKKNKDFVKNTILDETIDNDDGINQLKKCIVENKRDIYSLYLPYLNKINSRKVNKMTSVYKRLCTSEIFSKFKGFSSNRTDIFKENYYEDIDINQETLNSHKIVLNDEPKINLYNYNYELEDDLNIIDQDF